MIHQETIKKIYGTTIQTAEGNTLKVIGNEPTMKAGETVYTDGVVAYGNRRRLEKPEIIDEDEMVVPIYGNSCGYVRQNGTFVSKKFAEGKKSAFASNSVNWSAADGFIDISQGNRGINGISSGRYAYQPELNISSQASYVKWIDLFTGDNRPPGILIGKQIYENTSVISGQEQDSDFWVTGKVHDVNKREHYLWNEDGRHNVSGSPSFVLKQDEAAIDEPIKVVIAGKLARKISLRNYAGLADETYQKARQKVQAHSDEKGDIWSHGAPPADYIAEKGAIVKDARIESDGRFRALLDCYCKGETFIFGTTEADYLTVSRTVIKDFPDIREFSGGGQHAFWSDIRIKTYQTVSATKKKMSDWGGVKIEAHALFILTDSGVELIKSYYSAEPDGDGIPKHGFPVSEPGKIESYYELSWEYRHGLLDTPATVTRSSTGESYSITSYPSFELLYVSLSEASGADKALSIGLSSGDIYQVSTDGSTGRIVDSAGNVIATLPKLLASNYTLAGVDDVRLPSCVLVCDWRQSAIYKIAIGKDGYGKLQEFLGGRNYRLSQMSKFNLSHGLET